MARQREAERQAEEDVRFEGWHERMAGELAEEESRSEAAREDKRRGAENPKMKMTSCSAWTTSIARGSAWGSNTSDSIDCCGDFVAAYEKALQIPCANWIPGLSEVHACSIHAAEIEERICSPRELCNEGELDWCECEGE